jgi:hypothetical protein
VHLNWVEEAGELIDLDKLHVGRSTFLKEIMGHLRKNGTSYWSKDIDLLQKIADQNAHLCTKLAMLPP